MKLVWVILLLIISCSSSTRRLVKNSKRTYNFYDTTGKWFLTRETKSLGKKVVTRVSISEAQDAQKPLEKSITVHQAGSVKSLNGRSLVVRPLASEYSIWLEGKEYTTLLKLNPISKSMIVELNSPEAKWQGRSEVKFPKGKYFCFFSQLPECLVQGQLLQKAINSQGTPVSFTIVWDSYPYIQEQYSGIGKGLFSISSLVYENEKKGLLYFQVEVDGQTILYQFSKSLELVKMYWVVQGVSALPLNEELQVE